MGESKTVVGPRWIVGEAHLRRIGYWGASAFGLYQDDQLHALLGRFSWWATYFGRGQKIELPDGTRWRLRSVERGGVIRPVLVDAESRPVAVAVAELGRYAINGDRYAYVLYSANRRGLARGNKWILRHYEQEDAVITSHPPAIEALRPVPLAAVLLSLALIKLGIPGEDGLHVPVLQWGQA